MAELEIDQLIHEYGSWVHVGRSPGTPRQRGSPSTKRERAPALASLWAAVGRQARVGLGRGLAKQDTRLVLTAEGRIVGQRTQAGMHRSMLNEVGIDSEALPVRS